MESHMTTLDFGVLAVYFALAMGVGFYFYRRTRTRDGFTAADRSLPGWVTGLSILATYLSSISFLALPGKAYATNWNAFVFSLSLPVTAWIAVRWVVPYYRNSKEVSAYSHLEHRFGPWARVYASACYLLTQLARIGTVMYLMALPIHVLLGWDIRWIILVTGLCVTLYSFVGGITAVIWNDAIQAIVLSLGALVCLGLMVFGLPEGPGQLFEVASAHGKFSLGSFGASLAAPTFWVVLIYGVVINLQNFCIDQNFVQRYIASSSVAEARKGLWVGALSYLPLSALFFMIGTAMFVFYATQPELLPAEYLEVGKADSVLPYFIATQLPSGFRGLLIAAIFAAAMSTVSTSLNSSATILMSDFYERFFTKGIKERKSEIFLYLATLVWGGLGTGVGLLLINAESALDAWWSLSGVFGGGMLGLFLLGLISKRPQNAAAVTGVVAGLLVITWMTVSPRTDVLVAIRSPFHDFLIIVFGTATIMLVGLFATRLLPQGPGSGESETPAS
jgi:SSS family solute:Na+ symporter